ncbi:hypothetical protein D7X88_11735 [bacterium C-53]|nr:hypothetical protein [Lachnospiraceae bacterium]NBI03700.1 hypothetical protein [Lachnospiraceae bacterium]RKJ09258.1 hypothetical protein D7X88_11735 [bacterium C-53]
MTAFTMNETNLFCKKLLGSPLFDAFLLEECTIATANTFTIDGRINKNFYTKEEQEDLNLTGPSAPVLTTYASLRPICFELIKGKKTPLNFRFVFHLSRENTEKILQRADTSFSLADIHALVLTVRYDGAAVMCTTGTSLSVFSMDKSVEHAWDDMVRRFFLKNDLAFTEN